ncbi:uncharacterized protein BDR25DRAFT_382887 [Lindgomyces ingoldianus]|uniref:Uncharacterized protein n=1 Tax=Lindgomyces ingoldianus TaxID=673940 RepID=A0ACB6QAN4_9PLEO|nr:uncharacterized protein BDR25DRAFT_382887 [Lindgomyces ingoldianus]KAF2463989.1 hypothetical protein BDR25DRAFT_382887 [Lindgomyces ingoldianus]
MAPYPAPTPAPIPAATNVYSAHVTTVAPLTTTFTPPAACATNIPTVIAGSCYGVNSCFSYGTADFSYSAYASQNALWWGSDWTQNGAVSCYPSGYSAFNAFTFSPAIRCPMGYATLSWSSLYGPDYAVICCPSPNRLSSGYLGVIYASSASNYWCTKYMTLGDTGVMVAIGGTSLYDSSSSFIQHVETLSVIKTSTFSRFPGGLSSLLVYADGLQLRVAKSLVSGTPIVSPLAPGPTTTVTSDNTKPIGNWSTYDGKPHIFRLNFPITILIIVCFAFAGCCCMAVCCSFLKGCCKGSARRTRVPPPQQMDPSFPNTPSRPRRTPVPPIPPVPPVQQKQLPPLPAQARLPLRPSVRSTYKPPVWTPLCSHKARASCSAGRAVKCCRCVDTRARVFPDTRAATYCLGCKSFWRLKPPHAGPVSGYQLSCEHKSRTGCISGSSLACCGCQDNRLHAMPRSARVGTYCWACKTYWLEQPKGVVPSNWDSLACPHKKMSACMRDNSIPCCGCKDQRRSRMMRNDGVRSYCVGCGSFWKSKSVNEVPSWWEGKPDLCKHKVETSCTLPQDKACCTCEDEKLRPRPLIKSERIKSYCGECLVYWTMRSGSGLPSWWKCEQAEEDGYSLILHAKFKKPDSIADKPGGYFQWLSQSVLHSAKYSALPRDAFEGMLDRGPTYATPQFCVDIGGRLKPESSSLNPRALTNQTNVESMPEGQPKGKQKVLGMGNWQYSENPRVTVEDGRPSTPPNDAPSNISDLGPTFSAPKFEVPADISTPSPRASGSSVKQGWKGTRKSVLPEVRGRKPWDRGLQRGQPKFHVSENGTLDK